MFRYLVFVWNPLDKLQSMTAENLDRRILSGSDLWRCALRINGVSAYCADVKDGVSDAHILPKQRGVILGTLFSNHVDEDGLAKRPQLDDKEAQQVSDTCGQHLVNGYWGRYVAVLQDTHGKAWWVLRDPIGQLPCYSATVNGLRAFFSAFEDCISLSPTDFSVDWDYVAAFLCQGDVPSTKTGINGVTELESGTGVELVNGVAAQYRRYWIPELIASSQPIVDPKVAVTQVRSITRLCVQSWAARFPSILHLLSGGLDSSIVFQCLTTSKSRPRLAALNFYEHSAEGDERRYARLMAKRAKVELVEFIEEHSSANLRSILSIKPATRPQAYHGHARHSRIEATTSQQFDSSVIFSGGGGDQLFYQWPLSLAAADSLQDHGLTRPFWNVALDIAVMEGFSVWHVIGEAFKDVMLHRFGRSKGEFPDKTLVSLEARERSKACIHKNHKSRFGIAVGKQQHIMMLAPAATFYDPFEKPGDPERVYPLLSQPLIETCLRIPVHVLTIGGWDRAIARRAFSPELPPEIINRRGKGGIDGLLQDVFLSNIDFIRELLLDGKLVREGLLDRKKLEVTLSKKGGSTGIEISEIISEHINTEAWLQTCFPQRHLIAA